MDAVPRCLGAVRGAGAVGGDGERGVTLVLTGGLHGNEPAGVLAAWEVLEELGPLRAVLRGQVVAYSGNRRALARGLRFVSRDLNRHWHCRDANCRDAPGGPASEDDEQHELHREFERLEQERAKLVFFDMHSTSGPTAPFVSLSDSGEGRRLARSLEVAAVLGLEKSIEGSMMGWCAARGHVALSFEGGQHDDPATRRRHVDAIWTLLVAVGALDPRHVPARAGRRGAPEAAAPGRSRWVEIRHRHVVRPDDEFEMAAGFESFDPVEAGQPVARDRRGVIRSPVTGLMLMPRYQAQGEDGFFVAREVTSKER